MPQKLNISESLAFLIACIDASGKLDFKRLGDNLEIQPAAARMRLTRLRRAVANREFEDAILVQPGKLDPEIAALANPESRKLNAAASEARKSRHAKQAGLSELSSTFVLDSDDASDKDSSDDDEDGDEDEDEDKKKSISPQTPIDPDKRTPKRKAVGEPAEDSDGDETLFYKDTSSTSRGAKQIKLEDDREVGEARISNDTPATSDKAAQDPDPFKENKAPVNSGRNSTRISAAKSRNAGQQRATPTVRGMVPQNQNTRMPQGMPASQPVPENINFRRSDMVISNMNNAAREADLAQRAPHPPSEPARISARQMINRQLVGGGHSWPSWNSTTRQPTFDPRTTSTTPQPALYEISSLSSPASVFTSFRPAIPTAFAAANPATKRVIVPKDQRALLPVRQTATHAGLAATPQHLLDPALRGASVLVPTEVTANRSAGKRPVVRSREGASPAGQGQSVKVESGARGGE